MIAVSVAPLTIWRHCQAAMSDDVSPLLSCVMTPLLTWPMVRRRRQSAASTSFSALSKALLGWTGTQGSLVGSILDWHGRPDQGLSRAPKAHARPAAARLPVGDQRDFT